MYIKLAHMTKGQLNFKVSLEVCRQLTRLTFFYIFIFSYTTTEPIGTKIGRYDHCKQEIQIYINEFDPLRWVARMGPTLVAYTYLQEFYFQEPAIEIMPWYFLAASLWYVVFDQNKQRFMGRWVLILRGQVYH